MTLTEFLLARITEDEETCWEGEGEYVCCRDRAARNAAECEAKRALIKSFDDERHAVVEDCWYTCAAATEEREGEDTCDDTRQGGPCDCGRDRRVAERLSIMATAYADHPDYDAGWRP